MSESSGGNSPDELSDDASSKIDILLMAASGMDPSQIRKRFRDDEEKLSSGELTNSVSVTGFGPFRSVMFLSMQ